MRWKDRAFSRVCAVIICAFLNQCHCLGKEQKRLLLNDPSYIQQQLDHFQSEIQDLRVTVNNLQQKISALESNEGKGGTHFIRWGRKDCPGNFSLVFSGYAGGSYYTHTGAASEYVCLPPEPIYGVHKNYVPAYYGLMYGSEYEDPGLYGMKDTLEDVPCAVCYTPAYSTTLMISARTKCYPGWTEAYYGDLSSGHNTEAAASQYVCVDADPQALVGGGNVNDNGKVFHAVKGKCGALRCPPYEEDKLLSCVVCLK